MYFAGCSLYEKIFWRILKISNLCPNFHESLLIFCCVDHADAVLLMPCGNTH